MTNPLTPQPDDQAHPDEARARAGLHRLAAHANAEPTRPLGTIEVAPQTAASERGDRFDWRRLAVAAAAAALVGGSVVALNLRSGDSGAGPSAVAPTPGTSVPGDQGQSDPGAGFPEALAVGFGPAPDGFEGDARQYPQHQYAENADRPETGRFLTVTDGPESGDHQYNFSHGDFYVTFAPGTSGTVPPTTGPPGSPDWATTVPDGVPNSVGEPDTPIELDTSTFPILAVTEVDGTAVVVFMAGLSEVEKQAVVANIVPAPDGYGHVVAPYALPVGLSEIATGSMTTMFEPRPAIQETKRVELAWTYQSPRGNPVLDPAGLERVNITAIVDGNTGLAGQRLLNAEVRDTTVGDDPAVVQIASSGTVRIVWRHGGTLFMYEEVMVGDPDAAVGRVNELLPFFLGELADGEYSPELVPPATTTPSCGTSSPPALASIATTAPTDIATTVPVCDGPTGTYPDDSIPPDYSIPSTTYPDDSIPPDYSIPSTTYPDDSIPPDYSIPSTTYPDDWPDTVPETSTDPETTTTVSWPATTTTYPGQGDEGSPTPTTAVDSGVAPGPPVTVPSSTKGG